MTPIRRTISLLFALVTSVAASLLAGDYYFADGVQWIDLLRIGLLALSTAWLAWGASIAFNGLSANPRTDIPSSLPREHVRTAILVPVYNEDPVKTFSHVAAMAKSLQKLGALGGFDFAVLSDTRDDTIANQERFWLERLRGEVPQAKIFYRRRESNPGKKAGNIADFITRSGALYEYLVILDADSLMEGATLVEMVRRMEAEPQLGLLQTLPKIMHSRSFFGRAIEFSASYYSPVYARGLSVLQGDEGPFWGHNAITRTRAFAQSCGLPELPGKPPFGGHILSHDYVEAALLARSGWKVRVDPDLSGSFEEGPDNVMDFAKRDRRWCQGNLQHGRLVAAPGLKWWSRFVFLQGIMAYVAAPLWALFLAASIVAPALSVVPDYFPEPGHLPVFPHVEQAVAIALLTGVFGLLIGPKLMVVLDGVATRRNHEFGGSLRTALSVAVEIVCTSLLAPVMMLFQTRAVLQVLSGADGGWPSADREAGRVSLQEAWTGSWWIVVIGLMTIGATYRLAPDYLIWVLLVAGPQVFAPLLIAATSHAPAGWMNRIGLFEPSRERVQAGVIHDQEQVLSRWRNMSDVASTKAPSPLGVAISAEKAIRERSGA
ncbi:glucans biosynthesis glucosyltransferase MdoH [Nitratireductor basaltis]|uniref:Glucans biosynthesis glucosyltransferase H n=1 Tax=Nitratireductor basaltis TaxID=472175 RepID=A0A084U7K3_9HYPH|nr:glucans biosynthesis glucosyltransferase MdoH [Nitratireductor basaltis]KFB08939.1 Glycosyl transferase, family 2 precursor [Nitratireductor basaltis]